MICSKNTVFSFWQKLILSRLVFSEITSHSGKKLRVPAVCPVAPQAYPANVSYWVCRQVFAAGAPQREAQPQIDMSAVD